MGKRTSKKKSPKYNNVCIRHIMLTKESYRQCKKIKVDLYGNLAFAIESGEWYVPSKTYEYSTLKKQLEDSMYDFFDIKKDKPLVDIQYFDSDILSFEDGLHPNYNGGKRI
jgi:hypothetical protein